MWSQSPIDGGVSSYLARLSLSWLAKQRAGGWLDGWMAGRLAGWLAGGGALGTPAQSFFALLGSGE